VVLPTAGTWRISVQSKSSVVLVRGAFRQEIPAPMVQRPGPMWRDIDPATEPFDWPAVVRPMGTPVAGPAPINWSLGTFSFGAGFGRQNQDATVSGGSDFNQMQLSLGWRLQALPRALWLHLEPLVRIAPDISNVYGARAEVLGRFLGPDLRIHGGAELYSQRVDGKNEGGATVALRGYRPIRTIAGTYLIPSLETRLRLVTLSAPPLGTVDSDVYNSYAATHSFSLTPSLVYWAMPFQDLISYASLSAVTNPNVVSFDQMGASFVGRGVLHPRHLPPVQLELKYRASYRFVSSDRLQAYLQHSPGASIGTDIRLGDAMAMWLGFSYLGYYSAINPAEHILRLEARFDINGGRGLKDMLPAEQDFFDLLGTDRWGDLDEDGP
jgi:hypothetical protein